MRIWRQITELFNRNMASNPAVLGTVCNVSHNSSDPKCNISQSSQDVDTSDASDWKSAEVALPKLFHRHIFGKGGRVKQKIESATDTKIYPAKAGKRNKQKKDFIHVKYCNDNSLHALNTELESAIARAKKQMRPTHSIPVGSEEITANLRKFQGLCGDMIQPHRTQFPSKLHLTIGVLKLFSPEDVKHASECLSEFSGKIPSITGGFPLHGTLRNLRTMQKGGGGEGREGKGSGKRGDEGSGKTSDFVNIVYSDFVLSDGSDRLQTLADECLRHFVDNGLMEFRYNSETVKIHCTLINTAWNRKGPRKVDASAILSDEFELQNFGDCVLSRIDLNEMKSDEGFVKENDKRYKNVFHVPID